MPDFIQGIGGRVSPVDPRDWTLTVAGVSGFFEPKCMIDIDFLIPRMQAKIGSCVGNTFEEIIAYFNQSAEPLSWRFVYAMCKCLEGTSGYEMYKVCPEGTYPALAAQVVRKYGVPLAKYCPNDTTLSHESFVFNRMIGAIPAIAIKDAELRKSGADYAVPNVPRPVTIIDIKQAITFAKANNGLVAILREIGDTYWMANGISTWDAAKLLPIKLPLQSVGGHEELLYGYEDDPVTGRTKIFWLNHWSKDWCDNGRGWEYADVWVSRIREMRVVTPKLPNMPVDNFKFTFTKPLIKGDRGNDVVALQHCLRLSGQFPAGVDFTGFFGSTTEAAVKAFQVKYASEILTPIDLTSPTGRVGTMTLRKLNQLFAV